MTKILKTDPNPDEIFKEMVEANRWHEDLEQAITTIRGLLNAWPKWSWVKNTSCKYIQIKIDMRDGGYVLLDRDGNRISFDQLKWQYSAETPNEPGTGS
jgi:hypothetical protein